MAGSVETPQMSVQDLQSIANNCGYIAKERDSYYNQIIKK
jgi:2-iminoacetate synthase ThiH